LIEANNVDVCMWVQIEAPQPIIVVIVVEANEPPAEKSASSGGNCDPFYPDVCIPTPPPDLDCPEIPYKNFRVVGSDPHRFDGDHDGIGCER